MVTAATGLDASGYTFAYVAGWAGGNVEAVRAAAETVTSAARRMLNELEDGCEHPAVTPAV